MFNVMDVFERLVNLQGTELEIEIQNIKEDFILGYPPERQKHVRQQIWVLDNEFKKCKNPTERMNLILGEIVKKIKELDEYLNGTPNSL